MRCRYLVAIRLLLVVLSTVCDLVAASFDIQAISHINRTGNSGRLRLLISTLHPIGHTGYGQQTQLLVGELQQRGWDVCLLTWDIRYRGESAPDLQSLLAQHGISEEETVKQAGGDPRVLLPGVPIVTAKIPAGQGYKGGLGWAEILRASELTKPDLILHLHDAWWLGRPDADVRAADSAGKLPPRVSWLPILFDPLLSKDPDRPDRTGAALEFFSAVVAMSFWGRAVYTMALKELAEDRKHGTKRQIKALPPLLGRVQHAMHPAFEEAPLGPALTSDARKSFGLPAIGFVVLVVGRNPAAQIHDANRKSHQAAIKAFARFRAWVTEFCGKSSDDADATRLCKDGRSSVHLHLHTELEGGINLKQEMQKVGLEVGKGVTSTKEFLTPERLRALYNSANVLLQLSRAEGFGLPVVEAQACGTPVVVNGATAMVENIFLGKILPAYDHPTGQKGDRPGSWTPPDINDGAKALLDMWKTEPDDIERNRVRVMLSAEFAPSRVGAAMDAHLRGVLSFKTSCQAGVASDTCTALWPGGG